MVNINSWQNPLTLEAYAFTDSEQQAFNSGQPRSTVFAAGEQIMRHIGGSLLPEDLEQEGALSVKEITHALYVRACGDEEKTMSRVYSGLAFSEGLLSGIEHAKEHPVGDVLRIIGRQQAQAVHELTVALQGFNATRNGAQV